MKCDICEQQTQSTKGICRKCQDRLRRRNVWRDGEWDERSPMAGAEEETSSGEYHGDTERDDL